MSNQDAHPTVLFSVQDLLGQEVALEELLAALLDRVRTAMEADRCTLYLVDRGTHELFSKAAHLPELPEIRLKMGQGVAGHVAATGELVNVPTAHKDARFFKGVDEKTGYQTKSMLAAPMRDKEGTILGVLQVLNKGTGDAVFSTQDETHLISLAQQAGAAIEATTLYAQLMRAPAESAQPLPLHDRFNRIVGESSPMRQVFKLTTKAAASNATVLITGESGTGKELLARAVHVNSPRRSKNLVKVDCAALPTSLIENELFGHEKGAFTGADSKATGKFDAAQGGTIFLDEIGELPLPVQGKLLRVLQDREFERVGGTQLHTADVRVVAATNRDLEKMVAEGKFRADLYYRIKVVEIHLPPLRSRGVADIEHLSHHFVALAARRQGRAAPHVSRDAMECLTRYPWPGNVRELENCLEAAVVIMDGRDLLPEHLPLPERVPLLSAPKEQSPSRLPTPMHTPALVSGELLPGHGVPAVKSLATVEKEHILSVLEAAGGNRSEAARLLQIGRNTLARKLVDYGL